MLVAALAKESLDGARLRRPFVIVTVHGSIGETVLELLMQLGS